MRILSVDWDYFFKNTDQFDWGHRETSFFIEAIWELRAGTNSILSGKPALNIMRPHGHRGFWHNFDVAPDHLIIAESHLTLYQAMLAAGCEIEHRNLEVWNFDAHHDLGYEQNAVADCGNWALRAYHEGLIGSYKLVYPKWRKNLPEADFEAPKGLDFECFYEIPDVLKKSHIDMVFICRSGSWTPTWCDAEWSRFISHFKQWPWLWNMKQYVEFALKKRSPNLAEAKGLREEHRAALKRLGVKPFQPKGTLVGDTL